MAPACLDTFVTGVNGTALLCQHHITFQLSNAKVTIRRSASNLVTTTYAQI